METEINHFRVQQSNDASSFRHEVGLMEKKNQSLWDHLEAAKAEIVGHEADKKELAELVERKEADIEEIRLELLKVKSDMIDKEA